jgi:hypothetical protein
VPAADTPYPAAIAVSGVVGTVTKVTATLHGFHHLCAHDVDLLLVGPLGNQSILMSDAGDCDVGTQQPAPVELRFDDASSVAVPCLNGPSQLLQTGIYAPTNDPTGPGSNCASDGTHPDVFAAPAPGPPYGLGLSTFNGANPNGSWGLYAMDQFNSDDGAIDGGWTLDLTIPGGTLASSPTISGKPVVGKTLKATTGTLGNGAAPAYRWTRCNAHGRNCRPIGSATKASYKLRRSDRRHKLRVSETAVTSGGRSGTRTSKATRVVALPRPRSRR